MQPRGDVEGRVRREDHRPAVVALVKGREDLRDIVVGASAGVERASLAGRGWAARRDHGHARGCGDQRGEAEKAKEAQQA